MARFVINNAVCFYLLTTAVFAIFVIFVVGVVGVGVSGG